jgi:NADH dehydrogenase/NADH:ubiquinone oxidoreductase subunit G
VTENVSLTIDGKRIEVERGRTILEAARAAGIEIPILCYFAHTTANGLCRLCVVEVEGARSLQASCVTEARDGSVVHTRSERIDRVRRTILEMLASSVDLSDAPDVLAMLKSYQAQPERFNGARKRQPPLIDDNPAYIRDYAKCVLCWRCVQVCAEDAQYTYAINFGNRGFETSISTYFEKSMPETTCVFCGQCIGVCPTGALKGKREFLFEQGKSPEMVFQQTRQSGAGKRSRKGPHLDRGA